jgi:mitochondrial fission protein ELM1
MRDVFVVVVCYAFASLKPTVYVFDSESDAKKKYESFLQTIHEGQTIHIYKEVVFQNKLI